MTSVAERPVAEQVPESERDLAPFDKRVLIVAGALFLLLLAVATRYGYHRDEFYFLQSARHLSWGYVDQPVLTPAIARLSLILFGNSLLGLRLFPALAAAATAVIGGLLAREMRGGRNAQLLAAIATGTAPAVLSGSHFHGPTSYDLAAWAALSLVIARLIRTGNTRLWLVAGVVIGVGLMNKHTMGFFAAALVIGLVLSGETRLLRNRWFVFGVLIAAAFLLPEMLWQARHEWATVAMTRRLNDRYGGFANALMFVPAQFVMITPAAVGLCITGIRRVWRPFAWAYGLLFVFFGLTGGAHPYYVAGLYVVLLAAGAVAVEGRKLAPRLVAIALSAAIISPFVLPVLPMGGVMRSADWNPVSVETVGWPEFVGTVSSVWHSLPVDERRTVVIFTASYGEAGAINELGGKYGLPQAVSGHNNFWWWGPGNPDAATIVAVAPGPRIAPHYDAQLGRYCGTVTVAATLGNRAGARNEEAGGHVFICRNLRQRWGDLWRSLRHYD